MTPQTTVMSAATLVDRNHGSHIVATFAVLTRWTISELWLIAAAALAGLLLHRARLQQLESCR
jgi:hypothetical protein